MLVNVNGKIRSLDVALDVLVNFVERLMKSCVPMDSHIIMEENNTRVYRNQFDVGNYSAKKYISANILKSCKGFFKILIVALVEVFLSI